MNKHEHIDDLIGDTQGLLTDLEERLHEYDERRIQAAHDVVVGCLNALYEFMRADGRFTAPEPADERTETPDTIKGRIP